MQSDQPQKNANATEHHFLPIDLDDFPCARCPEVYDAGSVKDREILSEPQERRRFFNGEGCPACSQQESQLSKEEQEHRYFVLLSQLSKEEQEHRYFVLLENWYAVSQ